MATKCYHQLALLWKRNEHMVTIEMCKNSISLLGNISTVIVRCAAVTMVTECNVLCDLLVPRKHC